MVRLSRESFSQRHEHILRSVTEDLRVEAECGGQGGEWESVRQMLRAVQWLRGPLPYTRWRSVFLESYFVH